MSIMVPGCIFHRIAPLRRTGSEIRISNERYYSKQVQHGKQKYPYQVDEVPIQSNIFHETGPFGTQLHGQRDGKYDQTNQYVHGMETG